jgi:1,4-dihydroxy-2-naphthoate octaprenyltransferase
MTPSLFVRFVRLQFTPAIIMPVLLGGAAAWLTDKAFVPLFLLIALGGAVSIHIAANAIDDVYDFANGVDSISDRMFPREAPGWKPIPRGLMTPREGQSVAFVFYALSVLAGAYLSIAVGWLALGIAVPGMVLSWMYTSPLFKLSYRGLALGEISVLFSFGPIPALGTYYVLTRHLSAVPLIVSIPSGILTTCVLISHDLMFYEPYKASGKISLAVRTGRRLTAKLLTWASVAAYLIVASSVIDRIIPPTALLVMLALPLTVKLADFRGDKERSVPEYGSRTILVFIQSILFTGLLALGLLL